VIAIWRPFFFFCVSLSIFSMRLYSSFLLLFLCFGTPVLYRNNTLPLLFDTSTPPFSPQMRGLGFSHHVLFFLFLASRSGLVARYGPFNPSRAFHVIFDFDILTCFFFSSMSYEVLWFHCAFGDQWGLYMGRCRDRCAQ